MNSGTLILYRLFAHPGRWWTLKALAEDLGVTVRTVQRTSNILQDHYPIERARGRVRAIEGYTLPLVLSPEEALSLHTALRLLSRAVFPTHVGMNRKNYYWKTACQLVGIHCGSNCLP